MEGDWKLVDESNIIQLYNINVYDMKNKKLTQSEVPFFIKCGLNYNSEKIIFYTDLNGYKEINFIKSASPPKQP